MRWLFAVAVLSLPITACAQDAGDPQRPDQIDIVETADAQTPKMETKINSRPKPSIGCVGVAEQGGAVFVSEPIQMAKVKIGRSADDFYFENADDDGQIIIGFDRDEKQALIGVEDTVLAYNFTPREYDISRIDGLPPSQVSTFTEEQLARIRASSARKKQGFASRAEAMGFADGFDYPLKEFTKTSPFGRAGVFSTASLKSRIWVVDIAAPTGTPILRPRRRCCQPGR